MPTTTELFDALTRCIQKDSPKFQVISKKDSVLHRMIGWILKAFAINKTYMTGFWTTLGHTVAYPVSDKPGDHFSHYDILPHEGVHSHQAKRYSSFLFGLMYLMGTPVMLLGVLLLLGIFSWTFIWAPWWTVFIWLGVGLLLSCPVPFGTWRGKWELEAYSLSVAVEYWRRGSVSDKRLDSMVRHFVGSDYFWMLPYRTYVKKKLQQALAETISGKFLEHPRYGAYYKDIHSFYQTYGLTFVSYSQA